MPQKQSQTGREMDRINSYLNQSKEYGLEVEVIHAALKAMKENPDLSIVSAMVSGFNEWMKENPDFSGDKNN